MTERLDVDFREGMRRWKSEQAEKLATLEGKSKLKRWLVTRRDPDLQRYIEYKTAQESVAAALLSAQQHEANLIIH